MISVKISLAKQGRCANEKKVVSDGIKCGKIQSYKFLMVEAGRDFVGRIQEYNLTVNFLIFNIITSLNNRIFLFYFTKDWNPENSTKKYLINLLKHMEYTSFFSSQIEYVTKSRRKSGNRVNTDVTMGTTEM